MEEKLIKDFDRHIGHLEDVETWLGQLYYDPEFANFFNRPVLSMLIAAANYLAQNVRQLKVKYLAKRA